MSQNSKARVAVVAAAALVGGLVPVLAATGASAVVVQPTAVSVTPTAANTTINGSAAFTAAANNSGDSAKLFYAIKSGPDATTNTLKGVAGTAGAFTIPTGATAGVDNIVFFYDISGDGNFQAASEPSTNATLTVAGAVNAVALTPAVGQAAQFGYKAYTVSASDAAGRPVPGAVVDVTAAQKTGTPAVAVAAGSLDVTVGPKVAADIFAKGATTGAATAPVTTSDGKAVGTTAGAGTVYVASQTAGTVNLTASFGTTGTISATGSLTVTPGDSPNLVKSVTITPGTQNAFTSGSATETITVRNAQGDPVSGVTPVVSVTAGPNAGVVPTVTGTTNGAGAIVATYSTGATAGTDTVQAFVEQSNNAVNQGGLNAGEPSGTASVVLAARPIFTSPGGFTGSATQKLPTDSTTASTTFTLKTSVDGVATPAAGYAVNFTVSGIAGKYALSQASGVTDATGKVTVNVTNAAPANADTAVVTATLAADSTVSATATVNWAARVATNADVFLSPVNDTQALKGSVTRTVVVKDQFGAPISGLTYNWTVTGTNNAGNNASATGTGSSFTYTDVASPVTGGTDTVTVIANSADGTTVNVSASGTQYWVPGTAKAAQVNIDLVGANGTYGTSAPFAASGFDKTLPAVAVTPSTTSTLVSVRLADAKGNPLLGKSVSFTSAGVGGFVKADGTLTNTVSVPVDGTSGYAQVSVRSSATGTQTITASVDGVSDTVTINYTGEYNSTTPKRVLDSRLGLGSFWSNNGNGVMAGRLSANTVYTVTSPDLKAGKTYALNVTAVAPNGLGNLRIAPSTYGAGIPETSLVNYQAGKDVANFVAVTVGENGSLTLYSENASVAVAIDVVGEYTTGIDQLTTPKRVVDTRSGLNSTSAPVAGGTSRSFQIAGNGGIPVGAKSVALNVTAISPSALGNLRVYPDGATVPTTSNVNYIVRQDKSAFIIVKLSDSGKIAVYSDGGSADVAIDAFASFATDVNPITMAPVRIADTRTGTSLAANTPRSIAVAGKAGVPADAQAVLVSVTGIHNATSTGIGNLRAYPAGGALPVVSTLNYVSSSTDVANFAIVKLGTNGEITLYSDGSPIDVAVDVLGYVPAGR